MTMEVIQWICIVVLAVYASDLRRGLNDMRKEADRMFRGMNSRLQEHACGFFRIINWEADAGGIVRDTSKLGWGCVNNPVSSRVCERGTKGCDVHHKEVT